MTPGIGFLDSLLRDARSDTLAAKDLDRICAEIAGFFAQYEGLSYNDTGTRQLLNLVRQPSAIANRRLFASALLRISACRRFEFLSGVEWRRPLLELIENELGGDIYRDFTAIRGHQAHDKLAIFARQVDVIETEFNAAIGQLTSLSSLEAQQRALLRALSKAFGAVVLLPFLPPSLPADLREIYRLTGLYRQNNTEPIKLEDSFQTARAALEVMELGLDDFGTDYSHTVARGVISALRTLLESDLAKNPAVQKSQLKLEFRKKKYQLHAIGSLLKIAFTVKNEGPGFAYGVNVQTLSGDGIEMLEVPQISLARLSPGEVHAFEVSVRPQEVRERYEFLLEARWRDFSGIDYSIVISEDLRPQRSGIDWKGLASTDPYSLEPIAKEQDLVGRTDVLERLLGALRGPSVGSAIIRGQKRIGKTSIARVLHAKLTKSEFMSFYIESGDYRNPSGIETLRLLGDRIVKEIRANDSRARRLSAPEFKGALAPLADFIDDVLEVIDGRRIVVFIDEFDQLPTELYSRGPLGDSFFLTLRSITSRPRVGFVLIGGERIAYMLAAQGSQVNKWDVIGLDYFSREDHWNEFKELVQRPTLDVLEFSEEAFVRLHGATAGNPYFAKLVCRNLFRSAVEKRDAHITEVEVESSIESTAREISENTFAHFWDDGLLVDGEEALHKSIVRRKVLIAVAGARRDASGAVSVEDIHQSRYVSEVAQIEGELRELVARGILVESGDRRYQFKVDLFGRWLNRRGVKDILLTFGDASVLTSRSIEKIDTEALWAIVSAWPNFKSKKITTADVLRWLSQFGGFQEQNAILPLARDLKFMNGESIDEHIVALHSKVVRVLVREENVVRKVTREKRKESEIVVVPVCSDACELDFARRYVDRAGIYVKNVVEFGDVKKSGLSSFKAIIMLKTVVSEFDFSREALADLVEVSAGTPLFFVALLGTAGGVRRLEQHVAGTHVNARIFVGEELSEEEACFGERSRFYGNEELREFGKRISDTFNALLAGKTLDSMESQRFAIAFPFGCPRETLSVLRVSLAQPQWKALLETERFQSA